MYDIIKRTLDLLIAIPLLILSFPIIFIVGILIKLEDGGPIFFIDRDPGRIGKNGKKFSLVKIRSMITNADDILFTQDKELYKKMRSGCHKAEDDPRITKVGRVIRKLSIDELPQLINVIKGEMSMVGYRAYRKDELDIYIKQKPHMKKYIDQLLTIKPGITGIWQVSGRSEIDFDQRVKMEAEFAKKKSLLEYLTIILRTPWAVISCRGAT